MFLLGGMILLVLGTAVAALFSGLVLMLIAPITANRRPDFAEAWKAMFIAYLCQFFAGFLLAIIMVDASEATIQVAGAVVGFVVLTVVLGYTIEATVPRAAITAIVLIALGVLFRLALAAITDHLDADDATTSAWPTLESLARLA